MRHERVSKWPNSMTDMMILMMMTSAKFRYGCTNAISYADNTVLMVLRKFCLKFTGKFQQCFTFFKIMKVGSTFSPTVSPRMYVQTEGQISAVLQTHRSVFTQSIQAVRLTNFFPVLPRVKIYLHGLVFWGGTVMSTSNYLLYNRT